MNSFSSGDHLSSRKSPWPSSPLRRGRSSAGFEVLHAVASCRHGVGRLRLIQLLMGIQSLPLQRFARSESFGAFALNPKDQVCHLVDQLVAAGYLRVTGPAHRRALRLSESGHGCLQGEEAMSVTSPLKPLPRVDRQLLRDLLALRLRVCHQTGAPPYHLLDQRCLIALLRLRPTSVPALEATPGMGAYRRQAIGPAVLEVLQKANQAARRA